MCQVCGEDTAVNKEVKSLLFWSLHCYWRKQVTSREIMCTHINTYLYIYIYTHTYTQLGHSHIFVCTHTHTRRDNDECLEIKQSR